MNLDKTDLKIISVLYNLKNNETLTSYQFTKKIFGNISEYDLKKKEMTMRYRLLRLAEEGVIEISTEKDVKNYNLVRERCVIKKFKFPWGERRGIALKLKDNKWIIITTS